MGRRFDDSGFLNQMSVGNPAISGVPNAVPIGTCGIHAMKRSDSELNIEALFSVIGEGECSNYTDVRTKAEMLANGQDNVKVPFPGKLSEEGLPARDGGCAIAADRSPVEKFSSTGQISKLGWSPTPFHRGSSPASVGSGLTSGCKDSEDPSDDDDMETEAGPSEQSLDSNELRRVRRMVSNRESARRSRRRKQAHLTELESQVDQLRGENSTLYKQLTQISQQCENAATDNRVLKSDVEALRATLRFSAKYSCSSWICVIVQDLASKIKSCGQFDEVSGAQLTKLDGVKMAQELVSKGPLANIVNHKLLNQSPHVPTLNSRNLCRSLDNLAVLDCDIFHEISALPGMPTLGNENGDWGINNIKSDGSMPIQPSLSIEQLENYICSEPDAWDFDASAISKHS